MRTDFPDSKEAKKKTLAKQSAQQKLRPKRILTDLGATHHNWHSLIRKQNHKLTGSSTAASSFKCYDTIALLGFQICAFSTEKAEVKARFAESTGRKKCQNKGT